MLRLVSIGTKGPQTGTAYHAIRIGLKSGNSLRWLNISIKIGTNQFWWAPKLIQKQPSRDILRNRCSENMQQIFKTKPMPKYDFNTFAL